jgi:hypothetical protein
MGQCGQHDAECRRSSISQGDHGVSSQTGEKGARPGTPEFSFRKILGRMKGLHGKKTNQKRIPGEMERCQDIGEELLMIFHKGGEKVFVCLAVGTQDIARYLQRTVERKSRSVLEGMGKKNFRLDPGKAVSLKFQLPKEGGKDGQGVDRGAEIMDEMRKRDLCGTDTAAYGFPGLQNKDGFKAAAQLDCRSQSVGPRTHNDGIVNISL